MTMIEKLEGTARGEAAHDAAVAAVAAWPPSRSAEVVKGLRQLGHPAADAFENLEWEASFVRRATARTVTTNEAIKKLESCRAVLGDVLVLLGRTQ